MDAGGRLSDVQRRLAGSWPADFNRFAVAHTLAAAGDTLVTVSLAGSLFFSLSPSASQQQTLLYLGVTMVPFALVAPLIGPTVDRLRGGRKWVAMTLYAARAAAALALAFTLYSLTFYFFALAILVASKASGITKQAIVPTLVDGPDGLVSANSRLARLGTVGGTIAGPIGVGLIGPFGATIILVLACALFVGAAVASAGLSGGVGHDPTATDEIVEYRQTHDPTIVATGWAYTVIRAAVGFFIFATAFALRRASEPAWVYGAAAALYGLGVFVGNAVAPALRRRYSEDRLVAAALASSAVVALAGALQSSRPLMLMVAVALGISTAVGKQGFDALVQIRTDPAHQGRTFARFETRFQLGFVGGALIATAVAIPVWISLILLAAMMIPAAAWYEYSIRQLRSVSRDGPADVRSLAALRIVAARSWHRRGDDRVAVTELRSGLDLAIVAGVDVDRPTRFAVNRLRDDVVECREFDASAIPELIDHLETLLERRSV